MEGSQDALFALCLFLVPGQLGLDPLGEPILFAIELAHRFLLPMERLIQVPHAIVNPCQRFQDPNVLFFCQLVGALRGLESKAEISPSDAG